MSRDGDGRARLSVAWEDAAKATPLVDVTVDASVQVSKATVQVSKMASKNVSKHLTQPGDDTISMMGCDSSHILSPGGK